jgi:hypothetical protein
MLFRNEIFQTLDLAMTYNFKIKALIPPKPLKKPEIKVHIPICPQRKPEIKVQICLQPPKKPEIEVPTPPQPQKAPEFCIILPSTPLHLPYHQHLVPCHVDLPTSSSMSSKPQHKIKLYFLSFSLTFGDSMMRLSLSGSYIHAGVRIRKSIKAAREEFIKMMYFAKSQSKTTATAATFIKQNESWIMDLRGQNLRQNLFLLENRSRKASELMIIKSSSQPNIQRRQGALERFDREPCTVGCALMSQIFWAHA